MSQLANQIPAEFWLVRHGQTDWNIQRRFQGHTDIPLNALGLKQARNLAARVNGNSIAAIYSSDLIRARVTAEMVARERSLLVIPDRRLREIYMGDWEGHTVDEVMAEHPEFPGSIPYQDDEEFAPGGESLDDVACRVRDFADEIAACYPGRIVMVVMHGLSLAVLRCLAVGLPLGEAPDTVPDNCQVVRIFWPHPMTETSEPDSLAVPPEGVITK